MTPSLVEKIATFVSKRRMVGTTYELEEYTPQPVNITGTLYVSDDYDKDKLLADVNAYLVGVTFSYGNHVFSSTLVKSDIENEIKNTFKGVLSLRINTPVEDIIRPTATQNVLTMGTINITAKYLE